MNTTVTCYDRTGQLLDDGLVQWDINVTIQIGGADTTSAPNLHFCQKGRNFAYVVPSTVKGDRLEAAVPNICLQSHYPLIVFLYYDDGSGEQRSKYQFQIPITPREQPMEYVYVENIGYEDWAKMTEEAKRIIEASESLDGRIQKAGEILSQMDSDVSAAQNAEKNAATHEAGAKQALTDAQAQRQAAEASARAAKASEDTVKASQEAAKLSEENAAASEAAAAGSEKSAKESRDAASQSASNAAQSASSAGASMDAAAKSAAAAKESETNAAASENSAQLSAQSADTSAQEAKASETAAGTSATNAKASETAAKNSQTAAEGSASAAEAAKDAANASENAAKLSATDAEQSAASAEESKNAAAESAAAAKASENNAADSESNAASSAQAAADSAREAKASEDTARASQEAAKLSEENAATSAESAKSSETIAEQKAADAAASAAEAKAAADTAVSDAEEQLQAYVDAAETAQTGAQSAQTAAESARTAAEAAQNDAQLSKDAAALSEQNAAASAEQADTYSTEAKSYAVGHTGFREGEDVDNAEFYYEQAKRISQGLAGSLLPMGTIPFSDLATVSKQAGYMYNISDAFTTDDTFREGEGHAYPAGTNVYYTAEGDWDCLAGAQVVSVNGRTGAVTLTKADVGLENVPNVDTNEQTPTFTQADSRDNLKSGEKLATLFGKIMKWFADLKAVAFSGKYSDLTGTPGEASKTTAGLMSAADKSKLDGIAAGAQVTSVNSKTGAVTLTKADVGLGNADNIADSNKKVASAGKLTTPRNINNVAFDGTRDITVYDSTKMPLHSQQGGVDFNTLTAYGFYQCLGANKNTPDGTPSDSHFHILVLYHTADWVRQIAFDVRTNRIHTRALTNGSWSAWTLVYTAANPQPTATDSTKLPLTGGTLSGKLYANAGIRATAVETTDPHGFRSVYGSYGTFMRNDGTSVYCMITNKNDQYGGWRDSGWPYYYDLATGRITFPSGVTASSMEVNSSVWVKGELAVDGNLKGITPAKVGAVDANKVRYGHNLVSVSGGQGTLAINFTPAMPAQPEVFVTANATSPGNGVHEVSATGVSASGFTICIGRTGDYATTVHWLAICA